MTQLPNILSLQEIDKVVQLGFKRGEIINMSFKVVHCRLRSPSSISHSDDKIRHLSRFFSLIYYKSGNMDVFTSYELQIITAVCCHNYNTNSNSD